MGSKQKKIEKHLPQSQGTHKILSQQVFEEEKKKTKIFKFKKDCYYLLSFHHVFYATMFFLSHEVKKQP